MQRVLRLSPTFQHRNRLFRFSAFPLARPFTRPITTDLAASSKTRKTQKKLETNETPQTKKLELKEDNEKPVRTRGRPKKVVVEPEKVDTKTAKTKKSGEVEEIRTKKVKVEEATKKAKLETKATKKEPKPKKAAKVDPPKKPLFEDPNALAYLRESTSSPQMRLQADLLKNGIGLSNAAIYARKIAEKGLDHDQVEFLLGRTKKKFPTLPPK